jgi:hypothetical protein
MDTTKSFLAKARDLKAEIFLLAIVLFIGTTA